LRLLSSTETLWTCDSRGEPLREICDEQLETPEYPSRWQTRYAIDSMLEHAVMHPIRHAFQLDELIRNH